MSSKEEVFTRFLLEDLGKRKFGASILGEKEPKCKLRPTIFALSGNLKAVCRSAANTTLVQQANISETGDLIRIFHCLYAVVSEEGKALQTKLDSKFISFLLS